MRPDLDIAGSKEAARFTAPAALLVALLAGLLAMKVSGAWSAGFSGADEPAHFLNAWFVAQYLGSSFGSHPMAFATEYYLHYPKISIGHWPPAYYALLSPFLLVLPPTPATAFALNLLISSVPALLAALLLSRFERPVVVLACALAVALTPVAIEGYAFFMLDQAIAAAALAATILWLSHAERPRSWKVLGFALVSAGAVLIKGNAWLLLFVPPIHLLLTARWQLLRSPWPWVAALLAALIVGPWYWLTAGISADGFQLCPWRGLWLAGLSLQCGGFAPKSRPRPPALHLGVGPGLAEARRGSAALEHSRRLRRPYCGDPADPVACPGRPRFPLHGARSSSNSDPGLPRPVRPAPVWRLPKCRPSCCYAPDPPRASPTSQRASRRSTFDWRRPPPPLVHRLPRG